MKTTFVWVDADGGNRHRFRPSGYRAVLHGTAASFEAAKSNFEKESFEDPKLGEIRCDYGNERWQATAQGVTVFTIRKLWKDSDLAEIEGRPSTAGMRMEVLSDPRLHPDTIERLVEKFAASHDRRQQLGFVSEFVDTGKQP